MVNEASSLLIEALALDDIAFTQDMTRKMMRLWKRCIVAFVDEALRYIIIDSGMSAASLIPLGRFVGMAMDTITAKHKPRRKISAQAGEERDTGYGDPSWDPNDYGTERSIEHGIAVGVGGTTDKKGVFIVDGPPDYDFYFSFTIPVYQFFLHEFGLANPTSGPWNAMEKGMVAFEKYFDTHYQDAEYKVDIEDHIKVMPVKLAITAMESSNA